ncbi:MAG TPA: hypothetical protein VFZ59_28085 [Verrucomicrobiae bacterium]|nr:hypothetical protein [Verrucomicrobiae bacterium]
MKTFCNGSKFLRVRFATAAPIPSPTALGARSRPESFRLAVSQWGKAPNYAGDSNVGWLPLHRIAGPILRTEPAANVPATIRLGHSPETL